MISGVSATNCPFILLAGRPTTPPDIRPDPLKKLDDHFYPPETNWITKFDNNMIRMMGKAGTFIQDLTGYSKGEQVSSLMKIEAFSFLCPGNSPSVLDLTLMPFISVLHWDNSHTPYLNNPLEDQIQYETLGFSADTGKIKRAAILGLSASVLLINIPLTWNQPFGPGHFLEAANLLFLPSIALRPYLALSQLPKPPKKTFFERLAAQAKDTLQDVLSPQPVPVPVPVPVRPR